MALVEESDSHPLATSTSDVSMMNGRCRQALFLLSVLPLTVVVPTLKAQTSLEHEINAYLEPYVRTGSFSGVVLVARDHEVLYRHGYGIADVETGAPNQPSTRFQIASVAKSFTAAAILVLQEAGALSIDDRIDIFLPGFPEADRITIHDLLVHRSGLSRFVFFEDYRERLRTTRELRDLVSWIAEKPSAFEPGTTEVYSNGNYILLARIVEVASGRPFGEFLRESVLNPSGLLSTGYRAELGESTRLLAHGFSTVDIDAIEPAVYGGSSIATGADALYSTVDDLHAWVSGLREGRLLGQSSLDMMFQPQSGSRGYGWLVGEEFGREIAYANGWDGEGFSTSLTHFIDDNVTIVVLCNLNISGVTNEIATNVAAITLGEPYEHLELSQTLLDPDVAGQIIGLYQFGADFYVPNAEMRIVFKDGHLFQEEALSGRLQALLRIDDLRFVHRSHFFRVEFHRDVDGRIDGMEYDRFIATRVGGPVDAQTPN